MHFLAHVWRSEALFPVWTGKTCQLRIDKKSRRTTKPGRGLPYKRSNGCRRGLDIGTPCKRRPSWRRAEEGWRRIRQHVLSKNLTSSEEERIIGLVKPRPKPKAIKDTISYGGNFYDPAAAPQSGLLYTLKNSGKKIPKQDFLSLLSIPSGDVDFAMRSGRAGTWRALGAADMDDVRRLRACPHEAQLARMWAKWGMEYDRKPQARASMWCRQYWGTASYENPPSPLSLRPFHPSFVASVIP
ncbi:hypothetical protein B0H14DRAFT_2587138 [Mycena olivaceomarginata]|nr:hypothetical protein B0H14DRAFT_2587138 [Mycena olivaceomarginata]